VALIYAGQPTKGAEMIGRATRLDPHYTYEYLYWLGLAQFGMGRLDEAAKSLTRASRADPDDELALILLAATYGHLGRVEEAESAIRQANEIVETTTTLGGTTSIAIIGTAAPAANVAADANAACSGRAACSSVSPSSSRACAVRAFFAIS